MNVPMILAIVALICAVVDFIRPTRGLLNAGIAALALALLV